MRIRECGVAHTMVLLTFGGEASGGFDAASMVSLVDTSVALDDWEDIAFGGAGARLKSGTSWVVVVGPEMVIVGSILIAGSMWIGGLGEFLLGLPIGRAPVWPPRPTPRPRGRPR